ncbi:MAG: class I SAM-dependent methyltransferase [Reyranella sp.]|nr:class I SAM-dependent methyltransferase [Reyranella sp.]
MARIDFLQDMHSKTKRDYVGRVTQHDKTECAVVAKQFGAEYWDGPRQFGYGGYRYDGRWRPLAERLAAHYDLKAGERILDVGCGKGFLLHELSQVVPGLVVEGLDISAYALANAKPEIQEKLHLGTADALPFADKSYDAVVSLGTLHNLPVERALKAFAEIARVSREARNYVMVESFRNEREKTNLMYWQLTCESLLSIASWEWIMGQAGYRGDHGFIFFE